MRRWAALAALLVTFGCKQRGDGDDSAIKATPEDRKVIGAAVPFPVDPAITEEAVKGSLKTRRQLAWKEVERLLAEVKIGSGQGLEAFRPGEEPRLPVWQTYYDVGEFVELFKKLYTSHTKENRKAKKPFCPAAIKQAHAEHATKTLKGWTPEKLAQRLGQLKNIDDVRGVSGKGITLFSPALVDGLLHNYATIMKCPELVKTLTPASPPPTAENFAACLAREFPRGIEKAVKVAKADYTHCPEVKKTNPKMDYAAAGVSVAVKTAWHVARRDELGAFDSSPEGLKNLMNGGEWLPQRVVPDDEMKPSNIYTIKLQPSGREYWLAGIHFVVKSLRHWMWISLWWSDKPDEDFGQDRPASLKRMGPWGNYKMCVTTDYLESDPDPAAVFDRDQPSLAAAIRATQARTSPHTWCSNPYIERGKGNARTNCIGCHQYAGDTVTRADDVFMDDVADPSNAARRAKFPGDGRAQVRTNFPADYLWSLSQSPDFFEAKIRGKAYEIDLGDQ